MGLIKKKRCQSVNCNKSRDWHWVLALSLWKNEFIWASFVSGCIWLWFCFSSKLFVTFLRWPSEHLSGLIVLYVDKARILWKILEDHKYSLTKFQVQIFKLLCFLILDNCPIRHYTVICWTRITIHYMTDVFKYKS